MKDQSIVLRNLEERLKLVNSTYNPERLDLHFERVIRADCVLFEALLSIGKEAYSFLRLKKGREYEYWFYDFFLIISSASIKSLNDKNQSTISKEVIGRLVALLVKIARITTASGVLEMDCAKRNYEALGNLILAFSNNSELGKIALSTATRTKDKFVIELTQKSIQAVEGAR